ncbi:MAG: hypothetical protein ACI8UR_001790, partial [Natronomonas sp.]
MAIDDWTAAFGRWSVMDIDGDDLRERLDIDLGDARARADELYEYAFLPPSVTNDELNEQIEPATEEFADAEF